MTTAALSTVRASLPAEYVARFHAHVAKDDGHTLDTWIAVAICPAAVLAREIATTLGQLRKQLRAWEREYSKSTDPGIDAIADAGLKVPALVKQQGTTMKHINFDMAGLLWVAESGAGPIADAAPEALPTNETAAAA